MAFQVDDFRVGMVFDGARASQFDIQLNIPFSPSAGGRNLSIKCRAADLPGQAINTAPAYYFGREVKFAGNRVFQDWVITCYNDEDFSIRTAIEGWMDAISHTDFNVRAPNALPLDGGYATDAYVTQYGKSGNVIQRYLFKGIWPMDLSPIGLAWDTTDQIEEFTVSFAVQYYDSIPSDSQGAATLAQISQVAQAAQALSNVF